MKKIIAPKILRLQLFFALKSKKRKIFAQKLANKNQ